MVSPQTPHNLPAFPKPFPAYNSYSSSLLVSFNKCSSSEALHVGLHHQLFLLVAAILWSQNHITEDFSTWFTVFFLPSISVITPSDFNIHRNSLPKNVAFSVPQSLHFQPSFPQLISATLPITMCWA